MKGIYYKPKYIELIGAYEAPSVNEVANAIARKYNWTIDPSTGDVGNSSMVLGVCPSAMRSDRDFFFLPAPGRAPPRPMFLDFVAIRGASFFLAKLKQ